MVSLWCDSWCWLLFAHHLEQMMSKMCTTDIYLHFFKIHINLQTGDSVQYRRMIKIGLFISSHFFFIGKIIINYCEGVANLLLPDGQSKIISLIFHHFPSVPHFSSNFLQFLPQTFFSFFLILFFWVGSSRPLTRRPWLRHCLMATLSVWKLFFLV